MTDSAAEPSRYDRLARHLSPDNPAAGYAAIDQAIIAQLRVKSARSNFRWVTWRICPTLAIALIDGPIAWGVLAWLVATRRILSLPFAVPQLPLWFLIGAPALGLLIITYWIYLVDEPVLKWLLPDAAPPPAIAEWLAADRPDFPTLNYWDEMYWPWQRRYAQRSFVLGFEYWPNLSEAQLAERIARFQDKAVRA